MKNKEFKIQILEENLKESGENISLKEYTDLSSQSEPGFFRWLFDTEGPDFECPDKEEYENFLDELD